MFPPDANLATEQDIIGSQCERVGGANIAIAWVLSIPRRCSWIAHDAGLFVTPPDSLNQAEHSEGSASEIQESTDEHDAVNAGEQFAVFPESVRLIGHGIDVSGDDFPDPVSGKGADRHQQEKDEDENDDRFQHRH
jgi:hypothetical protein